MILIISHDGDEHAQAVMRDLTRMGAPHLLFDTAKVPKDATLQLAYGNENGMEPKITIDSKLHNLADATAVWWRRPQPFSMYGDIANLEDQGFATAECHYAVSGLWSCLDAFWINQPERDDVASRKVYQLKLAAETGLRIPRTLITNDPQEALAFSRGEGDKGTIFKAFSATETSWRETRLLKEQEMRNLDAVRYAPVIFQEHIAAEIDIRITVIGEEIFAAEIRSGETDYHVDFRMRMHEAPILAHQLPPDIAQLLLDLMRRLGLVYGAIDMRLTPDGSYVFLEVNTAGQWLFVEERSQQPITAALAARLHAGSAS